jgi:hypothetical protein
MPWLRASRICLKSQPLLRWLADHGSYDVDMTREKWSAVALILIVLAMIVGGCTRSDEHKSVDHKAADKPAASATPVGAVRLK